MARQWRLEVKDGIYHILSRGNQKQAIFKDDNDRNQFIDLLGKASIRFSMEIYAYVLMTNHYHILLKTKNANLSKAMQWIGSVYTRRFNLRHRQIGHLFQGRFKSILVENETYLLRLSYYIHRNPLRAAMVTRLVDYKWSSYKAYAYKLAKRPAWLNLDFILSLFPASDPHRAYRLEVKNYADENKAIWEDVKHGFIFGSERYIDNIKRKFLNKKPDAELSQHNRLLRDLNIGKLVDQASSILDCNVVAHKITRHSSPEIKACRDSVVYYLKKHTDLSNQVIGDTFNISYSAVSKIVSGFQREIESNKDLQEKIDQLDSQFKV